MIVWCKEDYQILQLEKSLLRGIIAKTCTINKKDTNQKPNYYDNGLKFNCMEFPNNILYVLV